MKQSELAHLLNITNLTVEDILAQPSIYKYMLKRIRSIMLKKHPDSGGSEDEFMQIHKLYELLQASKVQDGKDEKYIKIKLKNLTKNNDKYVDDENIDVSITFDDVLASVDVVERTIRDRFIVSIEELVLHFNKLSYCNINKSSSKSSDLTTITVDCTEETEAGLDRCQFNYAKPYVHTGAYKIELGLKLSKDSKLTIKVHGFEEEQTKIISSSCNYIYRFSENRVNLDIIIQAIVEGH